MLCCIIPLAVAVIVTAVTGSTAALFSGPMLYVTIALTALSMGVMAYYSWKLFSKYVLGKSDSCCETKEKPSCCHSKMKKAMEENPSSSPKRIVIETLELTGKKPVLRKEFDKEEPIIPYNEGVGKHDGEGKDGCHF